MRKVIPLSFLSNKIHANISTLSHPFEKKGFGDEDCIAVAEEAFKQNKYNLAITAILVSNHKSQTLRNANWGYFNAYAIHKTASEVNNWYAVLNIDRRDASATEIRKKYKELALSVHPDKCSSVAAEGATKLINQAWEILSDPVKRKNHDRQLLLMSKRKGRW